MAKPKCAIAEHLYEELEVRWDSDSRMKAAYVAINLSRMMVNNTDKWEWAKRAVDSAHKAGVSLYCGKQFTPDWIDMVRQLDHYQSNQSALRGTRYLEAETGREYLKASTLAIQMGERADSANDAHAWAVTAKEQAKKGGVKLAYSPAEEIGWMSMRTALADSEFGWDIMLETSMEGLTLLDAKYTEDHKRNFLVSNDAVCGIRNQRVAIKQADEALDLIIAAVENINRNLKTYWASLSVEEADNDKTIPLQRAMMTTRELIAQDTEDSD
jgi:hypothetical protein